MLTKSTGNNLKLSCKDNSYISTPTPKQNICTKPRFWSILIQWKHALSNPTWSTIVGNYNQASDVADSLYFNQVESYDVYAKYHFEEVLQISSW